MPTMTATMTAILCVWVAVPLGYLLSRVKFPGRGLVVVDRSPKPGYCARGPPERSGARICMLTLGVQNRKAKPQRQ